MIEAVPHASDSEMVPVVADVVWPTNVPATISVLGLGGKNDVVAALNAALSDGALSDVIYPVIKNQNPNILQVRDAMWVNYQGNAAMSFRLTMMVAPASASASAFASGFASAAPTDVNTNCSPGLESAALEDIGALVAVAGTLGAALGAALGIVEPEFAVIAAAIAIIGGAVLITAAPITTALYCQAGKVGTAMAIGIGAILIAAAAGIGLYAWSKSGQPGRKKTT